MAKKKIKKITAKKVAATRAKKPLKVELKVELSNPTQKIIEVFAALPQRERVKLFLALQPAVNEDQDKLSQGIETGREAYDNLIKKYGGANK